MNCTTSLTTSLTGACEAIKKPGGAGRDIYAGSIQDIDSLTYGATDGDITAITMKTGKKLVKYVGRIAKNTAEEPVSAEGEGNVNIYEHTVQPVLYHFTQAERNAIEELFEQDQAFFLIPTRAKQILCFGLPKEGFRLEESGMKVSEGNDPLGTNLNDQSAQTATFKGNMLHKAVVFNQDSDFDSNISTIEGLLTEAI